jgi:hypothetical protein
MLLCDVVYDVIGMWHTATTDTQTMASSSSSATAHESDSNDADLVEEDDDVPAAGTMNDDEYSNRESQWSRLQRRTKMDSVILSPVLDDVGLDDIDFHSSDAVDGVFISVGREDSGYSGVTMPFADFDDDAGKIGTLFLVKTCSILLLSLL